MRRIEDKVEFQKIVSDARTCAFVDSRREPTNLQLMVFDDAMLCTDYFLRAFQALMEQSGDYAAYLVVLEPDPVDHFYREYKRYPVLEIARDDSTGTYLTALNEDVGDGQGFTLCDLSIIWVVMPPSRRWFIHAMRSDQDDSGHLWVQLDWVSGLLAAHPGVFRKSDVR